jgi:hypothetical protein
MQVVETEHKCIQIAEGEFMMKIVRKAMVNEVGQEGQLRPSYLEVMVFSHSKFMYSTEL